MGEGVWEQPAHRSTQTQNRLFRHTADRFFPGGQGHGQGNLLPALPKPASPSPPVGRIARYPGLTYIRKTSSYLIICSAFVTFIPGTMIIMAI